MTTEGAPAFEEAAKVLDNLDSMDPLKYSSGLTHVAHDALLDIQKLEDLDKLGELSIETYFEKHGEVIGHFAQAVDFGSSIPELVVINLLVDDGDKNRGNRANIINSKYKLIGVSTGSHSVYNNCTVLMYARHFYNLNEKPGNLSDENYEDSSKSKKKKEIKEINQKMNIVRRSSLAMKDKADSELAHKTETQLNVKAEEDFHIPEGYSKIERQEKIITENGVKKKVVKLIKHKTDGSIETELTKENI